MSTSDLQLVSVDAPITPVLELYDRGAGAVLLRGYRISVGAVVPLFAPLPSAVTLNLVLSESPYSVNIALVPIQSVAQLLSSLIGLLGLLGLFSFAFRLGESWWKGGGVETTRARLAAAMDSCSCSARRRLLRRSVPLPVTRSWRQGGIQQHDDDEVNRPQPVIYHSGNRDTAVLSQPHYNPMKHVTDARSEAAAGGVVITNTTNNDPPVTALAEWRHLVHLEAAAVMSSALSRIVALESEVVILKEKLACYDSLMSK